ncbi:hypothetical protein AB833_26755 [Chromatiales bacterium (ex Bugula neritina AB1)]|nr:hypothetical protein AB833_26755 [Chromatiales bacterium (ex Bugula neritina AB1)]
MNYLALTSFESLLKATKRAAKGKRSKRDVAAFLMDAEKHCRQLSLELRRKPGEPGAWQPGNAKLITIRDPKPRQISVQPFRDRVVHHALCPGFESVLERYAIHHSYACRSGKGQHKALASTQSFARRHDWVFKGDIGAYFYSIPHDELLARLERRVIDKQVMAWLRFIVAGESQQGVGLPIGSLLSQHFANFYLSALDHWLTDELGFGATIRYMDDFLVFGSKGSLVELRSKLPEFLQQQLGLKLNSRVSQLIPVAAGVPFLGFRVYPATIRLTGERWRRFKKRYKAIERQHLSGEIDDNEAANAMASQFAHIGQFDTRARCRSTIQGANNKPAGLLRGTEVGSRQRPEPCHSGRLVQQRPAQRARGESQQERAGQSQRQPGFSSIELNTGGKPSLIAGGTDASRLRVCGLFPGVDQTADQSLPLLQAKARCGARGVQTWRATALFQPKR